MPVGRTLLDEGRKIAVLAGAGISLDLPSNLLDGWSFMLEITGRRMMQCQRFSVDLGGVLGEAQTTLILGRMYLLDGQHQLAVEEFMRVIELDRIVNSPWLLGEARRFLRHCADMIGPSYAETIRPFLQESMWGKAAG